MEQIRKVLRTINRDELTRELEAVEQRLPQVATPSQLQEARDCYCEDIFTGRLYAALPEEAQTWLSRAAVFAVPVPLEGLAAAAGAPVEAVRSANQAWQRSALVYAEVVKGELWSVYGTLRSWLTASVRLSPDERRAAQEAAGDYLYGIAEADRAGELAISWADCLMEARSLFLAAAVVSKARSATDRLSLALNTHGLYEDLYRINAELLTLEQHPSSLYFAGAALLGLGKYTEAIGFFSRITADESNDDLETKSAAFCASGVSEMMRGNYSKAEAFLLDAISLQNRNNDLTGEAVTRLHMARLFRREGKRARSKEECLKVLEICSASPSKQARLQTAAAHQIATIELEEGNLASARETFFRILELADDGKKDKAVVWQQIATIDMRGGAYDSARENFFRSLELRRELGVHAELATTLNSLGRIDIQLREFALAKPKLTEALAIARWLRTPAEEAETWHHLGLLAIGLGKPDRGVRLLALARSRFEAIGHADAQQARADLQHAIDALGYPSGETKRILADVEASYYADGGQTLYREAFGEELPILTDH